MTDLKKLAEAATPGPWKWWTSNSWKRLKRDHYGNHENVLEPIVCSDKHPDLIILDVDMEYIAAANPQKILELLQEVETLRADREDARTTFNRLLDELRDLKIQITRTRQETLEEAAKVCEAKAAEYDSAARRADERHEFGLRNALDERATALRQQATELRTLQHTDGETKP